MPNEAVEKGSDRNEHAREARQTLATVLFYVRLAPQVAIHARTQGNLQRTPLDRHVRAFATFAHRQAGLTIEPMHALMVGLEALAF